MAPLNRRQQVGGGHWSTKTWHLPRFNSKRSRRRPSRVVFNFKCFDKLPWNFTSICRGRAVTFHSACKSRQIYLSGLYAIIQAAFEACITASFVFVLKVLKINNFLGAWSTDEVIDLAYILTFHPFYDILRYIGRLYNVHYPDWEIIGTAFRVLNKRINAIQIPLQPRIDLCSYNLHHILKSEKLLFVKS